MQQIICRGQGDAYAFLWCRKWLTSKQQQGRASLGNLRYLKAITYGVINTHTCANTGNMHSQKRFE